MQSVVCLFDVGELYLHLKFLKKKVNRIYIYCRGSATLIVGMVTIQLFEHLHGGMLTLAIIPKRQTPPGRVVGWPYVFMLI